MRASGTDLPVVDRRGFFRIAIGGAGLAFLVAGGAVAGVNHRELMDMAAAGAGVAAAIAAGTALVEEATPLPDGVATGAAGAAVSPIPLGVPSASAAWNQRLAEAETASRTRRTSPTAFAPATAFANADFVRGQGGGTDDEGAYHNGANAIISFDSRTKTWVTARHGRYRVGT